MESWITILLGLALLLFQGYSEKKKREAARSKGKIISNEPFFFTSGTEPELEPEPTPVKEREENVLDTPKNAHFKPVDIPEQEENQTLNEEIKDVEQTSEKPFSVDPRQLVIFSEIMKPKYIEQ
ncbi:MAG: hypothetical protein VB022_02170 [Rikenellaceae bacterium]|nr:hypothetical protein [Rikenellaceae bacterium]